jgi:hypothetical protein
LKARHPAILPQRGLSPLHFNREEKQTDSGQSDGCPAALSGRRRQRAIANDFGQRRAGRSVERSG